MSTFSKKKSSGCFWIWFVKLNTDFCGFGGEPDQGVIDINAPLSRVNPLLGRIKLAQLYPSPSSRSLSLFLRRVPYFLRSLMKSDEDPAIQAIRFGSNWKLLLSTTSGRYVLLRDPGPVFWKGELRSDIFWIVGFGPGSGLFLGLISDPVRLGPELCWNS